MGSEEILLGVTMPSTGIPSTLKQFLCPSFEKPRSANLTYLNLCNAFHQRKIVTTIITIVIIIIKTRETIARYHWLIGLGRTSQFPL